MNPIENSSDSQKAARSPGEAPPPVATIDGTSQQRSHEQSVPLHYSLPLNALLRAVDGLSRVFWFSIIGMILSILLAALSTPDGNEFSNSVQLGEYAVPRNILPAASLVFALFMFWLVRNRLLTILHAFEQEDVELTDIKRLLLLNKAVFDVFDTDNQNRTSISSGIGATLVLWAIYFGSSFVITWNSAIGGSATRFEFEFELLTGYSLLLLATIFYGFRSIAPPLRGIHEHLHGTPLHLGYPRIALFWALGLSIWLFANADQFSLPGEQDNDLLGPGQAIAIDGETIFLQGVEVQLFGIDAVEAAQTCLDADGARYPCGEAALRYLQDLIHERSVICAPFFTTAPDRVVGVCEFTNSEFSQTRLTDFLQGPRAESLVHHIVSAGHALAVGVARDELAQAQADAQTNQRGIWQGAFEPPSRWRESR